MSSLDEIQPDFDATVEFSGSDPDDRHVHAAAVASRADLVLTSNGRDLGDPDSLPYEVYTPDEFFVLVDDGAADTVRRVAMRQVTYWRRRSEAGLTVKGLVSALEGASCPAFADRVADHLRALAGTRP